MAQEEKKRQRPLRQAQSPLAFEQMKETFKNRTNPITVDARRFANRLRYVDPENPQEVETKLIEGFLKEFPEQEENVRRLQENPRCGCVSKIARAVAMKDSIIQDLLDEVFGEGVFDFRAPKVGGYMAGKSKLIDATPEAYEEMMKELSHEVGIRPYHGLSVIPEEHDGPKWRVLFW